VEGPSWNCCGVAGLLGRVFEASAAAGGGNGATRSSMQQFCNPRHYPRDPIRHDALIVCATNQGPGFEDESASRQIHAPNQRFFYQRGHIFTDILQCLSLLPLGKDGRVKRGYVKRSRTGVGNPLSIGLKIVRRCFARSREHK